MPFNARTIRRLQLEAAAVAEPGACDGCTFEPNDDTMKKWSGTIQGPPGSAYAGGTFKFSMEFPDDYPFKPPSFLFTTSSASRSACPPAARRGLFGGFPQPPFPPHLLLPHLSGAPHLRRPSAPAPPTPAPPHPTQCSTLT
jgi:hypothetical protein